jgi:hypothetical protein
MTDPPARQSKRTQGRSPEFTQDPNLGKRKRAVEVKKQAKNPLKELRVELRRVACAEDPRTSAARTSTSASTGAFQETFPEDIFEESEEVIPEDFFNSEVETGENMPGDQIFVPNEPMPKYKAEKKLASKEVDSFLKQFEVWSDQRKYDEKTRKLHLPLAMENRVAQQWFTINQNLATDNAVSWRQFTKALTEECPMEDDDDPSFAELISMSQGRDEKASIFLQKIRYYYGDKWGQYPEKEIVPAMVKQLTINTRRYIQCRGIPDTYAKLMEIVKDYEERGGTKDLDKISLKTEADISVVQQEAQQFMKLEEQINQISQAVNAFTMNRGRGGGYVRGRGYRGGFRGGYRGGRGGFNNGRGYNASGRGGFNPQYQNQSYTQPSVPQQSQTPFYGNEQAQPQHLMQCGFCKKWGHIKKHCRKLQFKIANGMGKPEDYAQPQQQTQVFLGEAPHQHSSAGQIQQQQQRQM